jgi:hypothetical protein
VKPLKAGYIRVSSSSERNESNWRIRRSVQQQQRQQQQQQQQTND